MENQIPPIPTVPVVDNQQIITPEQPKKNNLLTILLSVLLFVSLALTGFLLFQTQKLSKELTAFKNISPTPITSTEPTFEPGLEPEPIPSEILTKGWKTYTNSVYGYTIKYPPTWWLYEPENTPTTVGFWIEKSEGESSGVWVIIEGNQGKLSAEEWWNTEINKSSTDYDMWINGTVRKNIQIAGFEAFSVQTTKDWESRPETNIYISKDERIYHIMTNFVIENQLAIFEQILSTFKFTN